MQATSERALSGHGASCSYTNYTCLKVRACGTVTHPLRVLPAPTHRGACIVGAAARRTQPASTAASTKGGKTGPVKPKQTPPPAPKRAKQQPQPRRGSDKGGPQAKPHSDPKAGGASPRPTRPGTTPARDTTGKDASGANSNPTPSSALQRALARLPQPSLRRRSSAPSDASHPTEEHRPSASPGTLEDGNTAPAPHVAASDAASAAASSSAAALGVLAAAVTATPGSCLAVSQGASVATHGDRHVGGSDSQYAASDGIDSAEGGDHDSDGSDGGDGFLEFVSVGSDGRDEEEEEEGEDEEEEEEEEGVWGIQDEEGDEEKEGGIEDRLTSRNEAGEDEDEEDEDGNGEGAEAFPQIQLNLPQPANVRVKTAEYLQSCVSVSACPPPRFSEFAVIGRSNVGKSSLINMLTGRRELALVSKQPGKTRCINHFLINGSWYLVDLPGYGFAKVGAQGRQEFDSFTRQYFTSRPNLAMVLLLVDASIPPQAIDLQYANWLTDTGMPFSLVFTKADKRRKGLTPAARDSHVTAFKRALLRDLAYLPPCLLTSSAKGLGRGELLGFIASLRVAFERSGRLEAIRQGMV